MVLELCLIYKTMLTLLCSSMFYCFFTTLMVVSFIRYWCLRPKSSPPGPIGVPFLGLVHFFRGKPEENAYQLSKKYGPIISVRIGFKDLVYLNNFASIQKAFVTNSSTLSGRPRISAFTSLKTNGIIFHDYNDKFVSQRKFGLLTLRGFGVGKKGMEKICCEELEFLVKEIKSKADSSFDISLLFHNAASNNICNVLFGKRFDCNDPEFHEIMYLSLCSVIDPKLSFLEFVTSLAPFLKNVPPFLFYNQKLIKNQNILLEKLRKIVKEHEKTFDENNIRDFIDAFIEEKQKNKNEYFTEIQLLHFIHDLFFAGTETSATTLKWAMVCLLHHPQSQTKIRQEIFKVFGRSGDISYSKKEELPYTNAFILEVMRYRTILPFGVSHKATFDTEIDGFIIPKDTKVVANVWAVHNDVDLWTDPDNFRPERFLNEDKFVNSKFVISFGVGRRRCLGEQLAKMEIFVFLVGLVQKFNILPNANNEMPPLENNTPSLLVAPMPFTLRTELITHDDSQTE